MKKRYILTLALSLLVGGAALIVGGLTGNQLFADQAVVATNSGTVTSFIVFGGAMVTTSIIFFVILARL